MPGNGPAETAAGGERPQLVLITGISGSGKSTAAKALEDIGFYCVDNLPLTLLRSLLEDPVAHVGEKRRIAVVADVRTEGFASAMPAILSDIDRDRYRFQLFFLDASEEALVRRYSETRRRHPVARGSGGRPVVDGIRHERALLAPLRDAADRVLDTSDFSVHDVRREIYREFADPTGNAGEMIASLTSFGFKHGVPSGTDLLFDVRFLPNPYFIPGLREQDGRDAEVREFLAAERDFAELVDRLERLLRFLLPRYRRENRAYVSIGIGCTGGRHRSVAVGEELARRLADDWSPRVGHRDVDR